MNKRVAGIVLIIAGVALVVWGYDVYDSFGSQVGRALDGDSPAKAWIGMGLGAVCIALGVLRSR